MDTHNHMTEMPIKEGFENKSNKSNKFNFKFDQCHFLLIIIIIILVLFICYINK